MKMCSLSKPSATTTHSSSIFFVQWSGEREREREIYRKTLLVYKNEHVHKESIKRRKWAQDTGQLVVMWAQATELKLVSVLEQPRYISPDSTAINELYLYSTSVQTNRGLRRESRYSTYASKTLQHGSSKV